MVELPIGYTTWAYVEESDAGNRLSSFCTCRQEWTLIWARGQTPNFPCTSHCQGSIIPESTILSFSAELELHRTDLWSCSGNYFPRASTTHCFRMFWTSWNLCKVWHPSLVAHFAFALHGVAETCSFAGSKNSAKRGKVASCQWLAFQFLFFCPSSAVKIWSFDILVWKSLFLETEVAHLMVRWLTLWPGLKFLSSSRFGANRVLGHPLQWINVSRYPDRPEFYLSFATAMNVLFFCIPKNFQRLLEVTAYCLALWQSLQVLGSLMFFEIKPANRMLQTAGCRRGLSVDDKGRNHDIHGLTLVMQSKLWRILTRSCSFCALRFLWYSQLFLSKEAASVYFLKGTAWRSPKLVRWDDVGWWCRWVQNTSSFSSKMDRCFASGGGFEGPGWKFTGDEVGISAFLVFFDHGKWLQMAAQICQVWSIGFGAIAAGNYDRFLTFWRIPYGFCLSALNFNCLRISLVLFSLSLLLSSPCRLQRDIILICFMIVTNDDEEYRISASLMASTILKHQRSHPCFSVSCQSHKFDDLKCHGWWPIQMHEVWILNCFEHTDEPPGKPSDINLDRHLKRRSWKWRQWRDVPWNQPSRNDSWQLCLRLRLGYSTYFMSSFMPQPHDFWSVDS